jgi:hypothetical protein
VIKNLGRTHLTLADNAGNLDGGFEMQLVHSDAAKCGPADLLHLPTRDYCSGVIRSRWHQSGADVCGYQGRS